MTALRNAFSLRPGDLDGVRAMLEGMVRDISPQLARVGKSKPPQPQNAQDSGPQQGVSETTATPPTGQPTPLSQSNLERQTQALNKIHQRTASKSGQPPAAPTVAQPPFSFGAQSPNGQPNYLGKPTFNPTDLHLPPARKKAKTGAHGAGSGGPSANSSPQVPKAASPDMVKRTAPTESKPPIKLQFKCPEPSCEAHGIEFATEDAQRHHIEEEHVKPRQNPVQFVKESLAGALGLDPTNNGKPLNAPEATSQAPVLTAAPMALNLSKQGLTPANRAEPAPMSREPSMKRQDSAPGSKPTDLAKTMAGRVGTPKPDPGSKGGDGTTGLARAPDGALQTFGTDDAWAMATIAPQDLFHNLGGLESGGGGAISDMNVYRAITPNDTPESSKDSAGSEPNSDISEGVSLSLNVDLDMGFNVWHPFTGHPYIDLDATDMDMAGADEPAIQAFSWDDVNPEFGKAFVLDSSMYSLDTT